MGPLSETGIKEIEQNIELKCICFIGPKSEVWNQKIKVLQFCFSYLCKVHFESKTRSDFMLRRSYGSSPKCTSSFFAAAASLKYTPFCAAET